MPVIFKNKILVIILFIALVLSLAYSFYYRIRPAVDAQAYDTIAVNLIDGFGFKEDSAKSFEFDAAIIRAGPGYEFFLAGLYRVLGHHYEIVWIFQALLHALSALLLFLICLKLFGQQGHAVGIAAAALFGLHPDLIEISAMLMTETLYLFLIIVTLYFFVEIFQEPSSRLLSAVLGLSTGIAILTRPPVGLFIPAILFFYYRARLYQSASWFLLMLGAVLAPWTVRNYIIFHQFIPTTLIGAYNLWIGNTLLASGGQISGGFNPVTTFTESHGFLGLKHEASRQLLLFIGMYPLVFIKLCFIRAIRFFSLIRPMGFWFYQSGIRQLIFVACSGISIAMLFVSGFSGMVLGIKQRRPILYYFFIFALISPLVLLPTVVQSRYRFQIYPFLAIFGGYFIVNYFSHRDQYKKILAIIAVGLIVISFIDILFFWSTIAARLHSFVFI